MLDIEKRILRHVSDAFTEDPLRVLRVARFLASLYHLGFKVAPETTDLCRRIVDDGEPIEIKCQFCGKKYRFSQEELQAVLKKTEKNA